MVSPEQLANEGALRRVSRSECAVHWSDELAKAEFHAVISIASYLTWDDDE